MLHGHALKRSEYLLYEHLNTTDDLTNSNAGFTRLHCSDGLLYGILKMFSTNHRKHSLC